MYIYILYYVMIRYILKPRFIILCRRKKQNLITKINEEKQWYNIIK